MTATTTNDRLRAGMEPGERITVVDLDGFENSQVLALVHPDRVFGYGVGPRTDRESLARFLEATGAAEIVGVRLQDDGSLREEREDEPVRYIYPDPATGLYDLTDLGWTFGEVPLEEITVCANCGSEDLGHFGETQERTENDYTDHVECERCKVTVSAAWTQAADDDDEQTPEEIEALEAFGEACRRHPAMPPTPAELAARAAVRATPVLTTDKEIAGRINASAYHHGLPETNPLEVAQVRAALADFGKAQNWTRAFVAKVVEVEAEIREEG